MNMPSGRKLGAAALILAGIVAIAVPLMLLHGSSPQGASPNPGSTGGNNNNNNNGGTKTTTTTTTPGGSNPGTSDSSGGNGNGNGNGNGGGIENCKGTKTHDPTHDPDPAAKGNGQHNGNAYGVLKNQMNTTVALVKAMGTHDPAYHLHHDTDTDNEATHGPHNIHDPGDHDSSCAAAEEAHDQD